MLTENEPKSNKLKKRLNEKLDGKFKHFFQFYISTKKLTQNFYNGKFYINIPQVTYKFP